MKKKCCIYPPSRVFAAAQTEGCGLEAQKERFGCAKFSVVYPQDYGVNLICVEDGIDSSKDPRKLTITALSADVENKREDILVQTMKGAGRKPGKGNGTAAKCLSCISWVLETAC